MSSLRRASFLAVVLCSLVFANAGAATDMYIKFEEPAIDGGSSASGHEGELQILSWSHGFGQPESPVRGGAGSGTVEQASHQSFTFTRYMDSATHTLLKYCWTGQRIGKATVRCYRPDGSQNVNYLTIEMQGVLISNYSVSGEPGDVPVENITLDYGTVRYTYEKQQPADSKAVPQSMKAPRPARAGVASLCSMKLPGVSSALPVQSWGLIKGSGGSPGLTFKTRANANATGTLATSQKGAGGGSATLTCGTATSLTLTNAKIGTVSKANDLTTVTLIFGSIE